MHPAAPMGSREPVDLGRRGPLHAAPRDDLGGVEERSLPFALDPKAVFDRAVAAVLLLVLAPVIVFTMLLIRLTSAGTPLYAQRRTGRDGRTFMIYKLRTMFHDCERTSGIRWATTNDPRVTPLGRILRKTHLDELPQLWNVLRGDMSLVGPRPERPEIIHQLVKTVPAYRNRERMLPGVTGLAQVQLPPDSGLDSVRRKLAHDLYYLENASLWLDLRIVLCTALKVVCIPSRLSCSVLGIPGVDAEGGPSCGAAPSRMSRVEMQPA